ncbi:MAG: ATP-binding protein, partial [Actinomycetota bacterium]
MKIGTKENGVKVRQDLIVTVPDAAGPDVTLEPARPRSLLALELGVTVPLVLWFAWEVVFRSALRDIGWGFSFFVVCTVAVDLIPIPAWEDIELSLSFPLLIGVAMLFTPVTAGVIALIGTSDPRELQGRVGVSRAVWNRSQMAFAVLAGSFVFHQLSSQGTPAIDTWWVLLPAALVTAITAYAINTLLVATHAAIDHHMGLREVLVKMHGNQPWEFLGSYIGLALLGAVVAVFYDRVGPWSVAVFLAPLVFARQMYFRSRVLTEQLADQNLVLQTQAARLEQLLETEHDTVDELRELNRMKGEFVAVVSHELRTPVTALIGYAKTLQRAEFSEDPALRGEFLERMERQGDRLLRLVENLLTTAKLESDELTISIGRVLFEDLCREVVEGLASEGSRAIVHVPSDLPVLHSDRQLLGRVFSNLLDNALKYSPDGSPVELGAAAHGSGVRVWVRDHGIGIDPVLQDRIFERFYQVDSSSTRRFRGAGLGLSMVRDLVDHLGGTIT